jgi:Domain of unknown function (DUF4279)
VRISGEALEPENISRLLALKPTRTHLRGESRSRHGKAAELSWKESLWLLQSPLDASGDPAEQLKWLLDVLEPKSSLIKTLAKDYQLDLFCGFSSASGQGGFKLDANTLRRLADLGIPLTLDLYPPAAQL